MFLHYCPKLSVAHIGTDDENELDAFTQEAQLDVPDEIHDRFGFRR
ncbi:hypothetical protein BF49_2499 [Bradyrhizobium sp.]|nr:hypothetical protein BF49_2499 [Bradyrhizobium sp.]